MFSHYIFFLLVSFLAGNFYLLSIKVNKVYFDGVDSEAFKMVVPPAYGGKYFEKMEKNPILLSRSIAVIAIATQNLNETYQIMGDSQSTLHYLAI